MLMPAVSGEECARVLSQLGFDVTMETRDVLRMEREWHWVEVPRVGALDEDTLCRVLRCARLTRVEFLDALVKPALSVAVREVKIPVAA